MRGKTLLLRAVVIALAVVLAVTSIAGGYAKVTLKNHLRVISFASDEDYMARIIAAVKDGGEYAMSVAEIYEAQRNLKIRQMELPYEQTDFFSSGAEPAVILEKIERYINPSGYRLTDDERVTVEMAVMAESGGEGYEGQMMVAQCILDGALRKQTDVISSMRSYQIVTYTSWDVSDSVKNAVSAVFDRGERVTDEKADLWYAPGICSSSWHESQIYIISVGCHRFFWMRD